MSEPDSKLDFARIPRIFHECNEIIIRFKTKFIVIQHYEEYPTGRGDFF